MAKTVKKKFKILDMKCTSCSLLIDGELEDLTGVVASFTSYAKGESVVEFDPDQITDEQILEIIKSAGYSVQVV